MSEMMMPCSNEAEQVVLGGLMLDNDRWDEVILQISPKDLFSRPHRMVFCVMAELAGEGLPLDLITITERLENRGDLEQCGGFVYLAEMSKNTPSAANTAAGVCGLPELFTGKPGEGEAPALTDEDALKLLRLMRRIRELQRGLTYGEDNSDE